MRCVGEAEYGECWLSRMWTLAEVRCERADPRMLITADLLDQIASTGYDHPAVTLTRPFPYRKQSRHSGAVLRIEAVNQTVVYRVGEYLPDRFCYVAEWPD